MSIIENHSGKDIDDLIWCEPQCLSDVEGDSDSNSEDLSDTDTNEVMKEAISAAEIKILSETEILFSEVLEENIIASSSSNIVSEESDGTELCMYCGVFVSNLNNHCSTFHGEETLTIGNTYCLFIYL